MTYRALRLRLASVCLVLLVALAISLAEYLPGVWPGSNVLRIFVDPSTSLSASAGASGNGTFVSQNSTLIALIAGAYSAYCLQQRGKFIDELRRWWNERVQAKPAFFIYCDSESPSETDYLAAFYKLSTAMDTLRLIYCNVGRNKKNPRGFYPFEQVRDIIDVARSTRPRALSNDTGSPLSVPDPGARGQAKRSVEIIFQSLRHAIQAEAKASPPDEPTRFDSPYRNAYIKDLAKAGTDLLTIRYENQRRDAERQR